jgi:hypothetical protein
MVTIDPPGASFTSGSSINPAGAITGSYQDVNGWHAFLRARNGSFTSIDAPGSSYIYAVSINPADEITGYYRDENGQYHGFAWIP